MRQLKRKFHLPGWMSADSNTRKKILEKECCKYPFPVADCSCVEGLREVSFSLLNDPEASFIVFRRSRGYGLSRAPGDYHIGADYSIVRRIMGDTLPIKNWLYEFSRLSNGIVRVTLYNDAVPKEAEGLVQSRFRLEI